MDFCVNAIEREQRCASQTIGPIQLAFNLLKTIDFLHINYDMYTHNCLAINLLHFV